MTGWLGDEDCRSGGFRGRVSRTWAFQAAAGEERWLGLNSPEESRCSDPSDGPGASGSARGQGGGGHTWSGPGAGFAWTMTDRRAGDKPWQ